MVDIAQLGIQVDSKPAVKAADDLDDLALAAGRAENATEDLGAASRRMAPALGGVAKGAVGVSNNSRMMALQLSQVAQQASATGNIVQALAIQLPDMAVGMGTVGIAAGVLASVALPLLASAFGGTGDEAKAVIEALDAFDQAAQAYMAAADAAGMSTEALTAKYGALSTEARAALQAIADVALVDALNSAQEAINRVTDSLLTLQMINARGATTTVLADDFGLAAEQADNLVRALQALDNAQGLSAQAQAAAEVQRQLLAAFGSAERMPPPLRAAFAEMARITVKASETNATVAKMPGILSGATAAAGNLASAVSGIGVSAANATGAVQGLVDALVRAGKAQMELMRQSSLNYGKVQNTGGVDAIARAGNLQNAVDLTPQVFGGIRPGGGGGGGGGGGSDTFANDLQSLVENLRTKREIEDEWYQDSLKLLNDRRAQEILGQQQHDEAMVALHEEYQRRIAEIDADAQQQRISDTASLFGSLASIAQAGGQKTAKIVATFQAIEGTVNAYGAAIKALNTPGLTLAGRFAAYASVLAAGLKGVAGIRAAGGVGGGTGGGAIAQGATATATPRSSELIVNLPGNALLTADMWSQIFEGVFGEAKARGMNLFSGIRFAT